MRAKKYMDGGTVKKSFFEEMEDLGNVGKLSSMGRGMSKAEAAEETGRSQARAASGRAAARGDSEPAPAPASTQTFGQAFRAARSRGDRTFEWRGRRYTTEMASAPQTPRREPPLVRARPARRAYVPDAGFEGVEGAMPPASSPNRRLTPEERAAAASGGMSEEDALESARRGSMTNLPRARPVPQSGSTLGGVTLFQRGGSIKKMASGGTCRGMGKATRGGDYKVR